MKLPLMMSVLLLFGLLVFTPFLQRAECSSPSVSEWTRTYGGNGTDRAWSVVQTGDGGYVIAGSTTSFGAGGADAWLFKIDQMGNMQWNRTLGGAADDYATSLINTSGGGFAIAGYTYSFGAGDSDFWLIKTDAEGNMQWNHTFGGPKEEEASSLIQTHDGGYAVAGVTYSFGAGNADAWLVKTDENGNMMWNNTYGGAKDEWASSIIQTTNNNYAIAGWTESLVTDNSPSAAWLIMTDPNGNALWNQTYGVPASSQNFVSMIQASDGSLVTAGQTGPHTFLVKTDINGTLLWNMTYDESNQNQVFQLCQTDDGGYAAAGLVSFVGSESNVDFYLLKTHPDGTIAWNTTFGDADSNDLAQSLIQTSDGGYMMVGETGSTQGGTHALVVKTDANGIVPEYPNFITAQLLLATAVFALVLVRKRNTRARGL